MRPELLAQIERAAAASQVPPEALAGVAASLEAGRAYRERLADAELEHRGKARAGAKLPPLSPRGGDYTPALPKGSGKWIEKYTARLLELGQHDAAPAEIPDIMWAVGRTMRSAEGARWAIRLLPPPLSAPLCEAFSSRVCPIREVVSSDGSVRFARVLEGGDGSELRHDLERSSDRKLVAELLMCFLGSHPVDRGGYSRVCSRYSQGARASCVMKADVRRSSLGVARARYGLEAWRSCQRDWYGHRDGAAQRLRRFAAEWLGGLVEMHQPPASVVGPEERGPSGFAHVQIWFKAAATRGRWLRGARRWAQPPAVRAFLRIHMADGEREALRTDGHDTSPDGEMLEVPTDAESLFAMLLGRSPPSTAPS